jgi:fluoroquinolone transport system permease protein
MLKFVKKDMMLLAAGVSPVMIGAAIRFGIPFIENLLVKYTGLPYVMEPYYGLIDILFASITPVIFCFVAAMVILEEHDDHIDRYLFVTELGRRGYYISRIIVPAVIAFVITAALLPIFGLSDQVVAVEFSLAIAGTLQGIIIALLVVTLSSNKLEGMALTKLSSLLMLGAVVPYLVPKPYSFILSFMPSFWTGMMIYEKNIVYMAGCIVVSVVWIGVLGKASTKK